MIFFAMVISLFHPPMQLDNSALRTRYDAFCAEDLHVHLNEVSVCFLCSSVSNILVRFTTNDQYKKHYYISHGKNPSDIQ